MATPKLRFKEFDGDWTSKQLGKIIGISSASRVFKEQWQDSGVPFFRTSDVVSIFKNKENEKAYISLELFEELAKKSGKIKQGDLLVTGGGSIGIPYLVPNDQPLYFKDADLLWMKSSGIVEGSFLYNFFISPKFREYLKSISHTGTISHFTIEQAKATPFGFPSKEEQTKIASFLSAVDEKISQLTQKHELLSQYKQGMMQKLFSQQLRFKADDGSEFGAWGNLKIFDLAKDKTLNNGVFNDQNKVGKGYKLINVLDMYINRDIDESRLKLLDLSKKEFETNKVYYGDIFFTRSSLVKEGIAFSNVYLGNSNDVTYDGHLIKLTPDLDRVSPIFLNYVLKTNAVRKQLIKGGKTATMTTIGQQEVGNTMVPLPCLEEQTKIANFLSAIDQKIEVVAQQIEQAKIWKKGLLQQMFV
ncbi:restriction endonuclease subunit S [Acinetobacter sp. ACNIH3]|uniref:restriction endonuclease subunit S n=1 Tax=unclassified Acinetobacter TaxID=196816 RepID=UPI000CDD4A89|nr:MULTISPECIES: restriction endonuclease subunit S [unclassified Acinetobacter]POU24742.1 restriction endonuclease subunit S [Acinetobacter sp. ACNIH3]POV74344.1 restriction endonuclease subunit S [Acinetobacter sp. ACNIH4]